MTSSTRWIGSSNSHCLSTSMFSLSLICNGGKMEEDLGLIGDVEGELVGVDPAEINGGGDQIESAEIRQSCNFLQLYPLNDGPAMEFLDVVAFSQRKLRYCVIKFSLKFSI